MAGGRRSRRGGRRGGRGRRLVDPGVDIEDAVLIALLRHSQQVHRDELRPYDEVPLAYRNGLPAVQALNRGCNTIFRQMAHLRRRFLNLMRGGTQNSPEGRFIEARLDMFEREILILHDQIKALDGIFFPVPRVFCRPLALIK